MRAARIVLGVTVLVAACRSKPSDSASERVTAAPEKAKASASAVAPVVPLAGTCPYPTSIVERNLGEWKALLAGDPIEQAPSWRGDADGTGLKTLDGVRFEIDMTAAPPLYAMSNDLVAYKGKKELWRAKGFSVAGGAFEALLSPHETIVSRSYSRGSNELFDAKTGRSLAAVGLRSVISPDDRYVVDPPYAGFTAPLDNDVMVVSLPSGTKKSIASPPTGSEPTEFDVALCTTGATFVVTHQKGELAIFRADNMSKAASFDKPGPGIAAFSKSGRFVAMVDRSAIETPLRLFELR